MVPLESELQNVETSVQEASRIMNQYHFSLGGNWEYDHGYFDRNLDEEQKVWIRFPFQVTKGRLDSESANEGTEIRFGSPFVLKHLYNEGLEEEAQMNTYGALVNQFQTPTDPDASIDEKWLEQASEIMREMDRYSWN